MSLRTLVEANADGLLVVDRDGVVLFANPAAEHLLGRTADDLVGTPVGLPVELGGPHEVDLVAPGDPPPVAELRVVEIEWEGRTALLASLRDVTARRRAEEELRRISERLSSLFSASPAAMFEWAPDGTVLSWNRAAERIVGWEARDVVGDACPLLNGPALSPDGGLRDQVLSGMRLADVEVRVRRPNGTEIDLSLSTAPVLDELGALSSIVGVALDVSERRRREAEIRHLATHDPLTDLPNRRTLEDAMERVVRRARHERGGVPTAALLILDLDRFKQVNDTLGHLAGDQLLMGITRVLNDALRPGDLLARWGGDEFAVLLQRVGLEDTRTIAERLRLDARDYRLGSSQMSTSVSVGGALIDGRLDPSEIMSVADLALAEAKAAGKDRVVVHGHAQAKALEIAEETRGATRLRTALADDRLELHHQPIVDLGTGAVECWEALVRVREGDRLHEPPEFLAIADSVGILPALDRWVASQSLARLRDDPGLSLTVNVSRWTLGDESYLELIAAGRPAEGLGGRLILEVTEQILLADLLRAREWIDAARGLGCRIALDDFGVNFSSFAYLRSLPVDLVKVDRSFVRNLDDAENRAILRAITSVSRALGRRVVAEGIEDEATLRAVRRLRIPLGQGYLLGRPEPEAPAAAPAARRG